MSRSICGSYVMALSQDMKTNGSVNTHSIFRLVCCATFIAPALISLVQRGWSGEAGSLAPVVLMLGGWTVWNRARYETDRLKPSSNSFSIWFMAMLIIVPVYLFGQAIDMITLTALAGWAGLVCCIYVWYGSAILKKCALPIGLTALAVPLPYSLSAGATGWLRDTTSYFAIKLADSLMLDVAGNGQKILVGPYVLKVEDACAGATSMLSLIAIGILYAYWFRSGGAMRTTLTVIAAIPIAFIANVLRVAVLLGIISLFGVSVLDGILHPLAGLLSFSLSMIMLILWSKGLDYLAIGPHVRNDVSPNE